MSTPYVGRPNDYGIQTMTEQEIVDAVENAHRHATIHGAYASYEDAPKDSITAGKTTHTSEG